MSLGRGSARTWFVNVSHVEVITAGQDSATMSELSLKNRSLLLFVFVAMVCNAPPIVSNAQMITADIGIYTLGDTVMYMPMCDEGYRPSDDVTHISVCNVDGHWSNVTILCVGRCESTMSLS